MKMNACFDECACFLGEEKSAIILAGRETESRHSLSLQCINSDQTRSLLESAKPGKLEFVVRKNTEEEAPVKSNRDY